MIKRLLELVAINRAITESLDYDEVLRLIVEKTVAFTNAHACFLVLADVTDTATILASKGVDENQARSFRAPWGESINVSLRELVRARQIDTFLGVPIVQRGRIAGMLAVYRRGPEPPRPDEESLLAALADQAAIALSHAARYKQSRHELEESQEFNRRVLEVIGQAVVVTDPQGTITYWNAAAGKLYGWSADETLGRNIMDVAVPVGLADRAREIMAALARGETWSGEFDVRHRDGTLISVVVSDSPIRDGSGAVVAIVRVATDVRKMKQIENALRQADRRKNEFLAMLSHELRNPLAPLQNSLYVLEHAAPASERATRARAVIGRQMVHLTRLVDDLLDVTRLAGSKLRLERGRLDLVDAVRRTAEDHVPLLTSRGIALDVQAPIGPLWMSGDAARIAQVVGNLLANAAKFTPKGGKVTLTLRQAESNVALIQVRDSGVGIRPELLGRLFEPFMQAESTLALSGGGLGLGLAIVKGIAEMHGGSVEAHSEGLGKGAEFIVRLPIEPQRTSQPVFAEPPPDRPPPRRVLVIEDNQDAADSLRDVLLFGAHQVEVAYNGPEGIERARAFKPDIVLCDIGLPGMNGYEVAHAFQADSTLRSAYLVAISGYVQPDDQRRAAEAGFQQHLSKPPSLEMIEEVLRNVPLQ
jgi:two-component system CheB/CheR fusion protein